LRAVAEGDWHLVEVLGRVMKGAEGAPVVIPRVAPLVPGISPPPVTVMPPRVRKPRAAVVVPPPPPVPPPRVRNDDADMGTPAWPPGDLDWQASPSGHYHGFWRSGDRAGKLAAVVPVLPPGAVLVEEEEEETK